MPLGLPVRGTRGTGRPGLARRALAGVILALAFGFGGVGARGQTASDDTVWAASFDPATQTRYIPLELILGAPWDGRREIVLPAGDFIEGVPAKMNPSTWHGPIDWRHPETGATLRVYDRSRYGVVQKFAVRADGTAIGRVTDNRFEIGSCDQEGKYPLGLWKQGETRLFDSHCWRAEGRTSRVSEMVTSITIEKIDFPYAGAPHSLQIHWILKRKGETQELDNRLYVFSPRRGLVYVR